MIDRTAQKANRGPGGGPADSCSPARRCAIGTAVKLADALDSPIPITKLESKHTGRRRNTSRLT